jgi:hypothetical protein
MTSQLPRLPDIFKDLVSCINIDNTLNKCNKKCKLTYYFKDSGIVARNMGTHILIELDDTETVCADYSSPDSLICSNGGFSKLVVKELRLYVPSRHSYKNQIVAGELFIVLKNTQGGRDLIISIPISNSTGTVPYASSVLSEVITFLETLGNSEGEGGNVTGLSVNLNKMIPKNIGYYSYVGHVPWITEKAAINWMRDSFSFNTIFNDTILTCYDIIVYDVKDVAIYVNKNNFNKINTILPFFSGSQSSDRKLTKRAAELLLTYNIIKTYNLVGEVSAYKPNTKKFDNGVTPLQKSKLAYNNKGATYFKNDEIWIDCAPTGSEGNELVIYKKPDSVPSVIFTQYFQVAFLIFVTILSTIIIIAIFKYGPNLFKGKVKKPALGGAAGGPAGAGGAAGGPG